SSQVQIDHVVALSDAWQKGAQQWDVQTRRNFANDPRNLRAVKGSLNSQKGAGDAATWLPPRREFRCDYARDIIDVKSDYGLWVTPAEKEALHTQLSTCDISATSSFHSHMTLTNRRTRPASGLSVRSLLATATGGIARPIYWPSRRSWSCISLKYSRADCTC